jgi:hypothetical protein
MESAGLMMSWLCAGSNFKLHSALHLLILFVLPRVLCRRRSSMLVHQTPTLQGREYVKVLVSQQAAAPAKRYPVRRCKHKVATLVEFCDPHEGCGWEIKHTDPMLSIRSEILDMPRQKGENRIQAFCDNITGSGDQKFVKKCQNLLTLMYVHASVACDNSEQRILKNKQLPFTFASLVENLAKRHYRDPR